MNSQELTVFGYLVLLLGHAPGVAGRRDLGADPLAGAGGRAHRADVAGRAGALVAWARLAFTFRPVTPARLRNMQRACEAISLRRHYPDQVMGVACGPLSLP